MDIFTRLWAALKNWIKSLDEEWDEMTAEDGRASSARDCKDVTP